MAKKVLTTKVCDPPHEAETVAVVTRRFGYGDIEYETDLCAAHDLELGSVLGEFAAYARPTGPVQQVKRRDRQQEKDGAAECRKWARQKGIEVAERGRISPTILAQFRAERGR